MLRDLRFGFRVLVRNPLFALAALTVMALGVGATTAVFTVVRGVLLHDLPYREPDRLVLFRASLPGYERYPLLTPAELSALRDRSDLFESVSVISESQANLTSPDDMAVVTAAAIGDNFFETLGVEPALGRLVTRQDLGGGIRAVTISDELWRTHFQGDPRIVGRRIEIDNRPATVAGVLPRGFRLYLGPGVHVATRIDVVFPRGRGYDDDPARTAVVIARLKSGVSIGGAQAAVDALAASLVAGNPGSYRSGPVRISLAALDREVVSDVQPALVALSGAVAFVLLVACANLMNLLLARASARAREIALRTSIGASPGRIARQLLAEGLVIGGLGAAGGLLVANWGVAALLRLAPATLPRLEAVRIDAGVAGFGAGLSLLCALAVSLIPAWQAARADVSATLKQTHTAAGHGGTTRGLLVAAQLALSLVLLVGAGLMTRAFINMRLAPLGFDPDGAVTMNVRLFGERFNGATLADDREKRLVFYHQLADSVREIPGVEQAGVGLPVPLAGPPLTQRVSLEASQPEHPTEGAIALAGLLETLRVRLVAGRFFAAADDNRPVVIIDQRLAAELWPDGSQAAVGRRALFKTAIGQQWVEVIGVVSHVQMRGLRGGDLPQIWMTYGTRSYAALNLVVRGANPSALVEPVRQAIQRLGPGRPVHDIRLLEDYVADASADTRFALFVLGAFAIVALVLSALGVYGVVAYVTARRTREIAVRMALGADARGIVGLVVREGMAWTIAGLAAGLTGGLALTRYLDSLLFHVGATDPLTFAAVAAVLASVAAAATALPAIRAVRIDPMLSLRSE
jgi:putative ABC transport system permease protein